MNLIKFNWNSNKTDEIIFKYILFVIFNKKTQNINDFLIIILSSIKIYSQSVYDPLNFSLILYTFLSNKSTFFIR